MAKKLWGGRFGKKTDPLVEEFTKSIQYDYKLARWDVAGSKLHVRILEKNGLLSHPEAVKLMSGLDSIGKKLKKKEFKQTDKVEDIHTYIQNELQRKVGDLALKLHTARSRNDQVVFSVKVYCKKMLLDICEGIITLTEVIEDKAKKNSGVIIPGFTHLQHAQPVMLLSYLQAYVDMLLRDMERLVFVSRNIKIAMGAGALAGTPIAAGAYQIKARELMKELKLGSIVLQPVSNAVDTVSDRDFVIEIISALSILAMHLSRLSEDLIIWSTKEFDFVEIDEAYCTGSSLMPQKKNPDVLELVRGYAGRLCGNLVGVLTMMKGLPLAYNRDMQLDKEPLFNSFEIVSGELKVLAGLIKTLKFNKDKIEEHLKDEGLYATDLVYYLVDKGVPFKEAHTIIGKLVKYSLDNDIQIKDMPQGMLEKFSRKISKKEIMKLFDPLVSVKSKKSVKRG